MFKEFYVKIISGVFSKLMSHSSTKQVNPKDEMSKALESIQRMKRVVIEKKENSSNVVDNSNSNNDGADG
jgi:hypothetical protein